MKVRGPEGGLTPEDEFTAYGACIVIGLVVILAGQALGMPVVTYIGSSAAVGGLTGMILMRHRIRY